jgi:hypothetical protein
VASGETNADDGVLERGDGRTGRPGLDPDDSHSVAPREIIAGVIRSE